MSIRIIKRGRDNDDFYAVCPNCGTEFICHPKDGKYIPRPALRPTEGGYVSVNCPVCGRGCTAYEVGDDRFSGLKDIYDS